MNTIKIITQSSSLPDLPYNKQHIIHSIQDLNASLPDKNIVPLLFQDHWNPFNILTTLNIDNTPLLATRYTCPLNPNNIYYGITPVFIFSENISKYAINSLPNYIFDTTDPSIYTYTKIYSPKTNNLSPFIKTYLGTGYSTHPTERNDYTVVLVNLQLTNEDYILAVTLSRKE
ncbi:MAG: hypothetical protein PHF86_05090 [Candidatus Nanoarchaeia archaeon]|nr:hypothetical protein [Candidatus Nanoarchaeia archaeon]